MQSTVLVVTRVVISDLTLESPVMVEPEAFLYTAGSVDHVDGTAVRKVVRFSPTEFHRRDHVIQNRPSCILLVRLN